MALVDDDFWRVRRKFGGACGASCRGAPYLRLRPTPCNANKERQQRSRALWARVGRFWHDELESWERLDWNLEVGWWSWHDRLDQYRELTGFEFFAGFAARNLLAGREPCRNPYDLAWGYPLTTLQLSLVSSCVVEATFTPMPSPSYWGLALYGRGPVSLGVSPVVSAPAWGRDCVPNGWYWVGFGELGDAGPLEFTLPREIRTGTKLVCIGCLMFETGQLHEEWLMAEVAA